jgi:aminopeptidase-like protein
LSGVALAMFLARHLGGRALRYSYRFLFIPGTMLITGSRATASGLYRTASSCRGRRWRGPDLQEEPAGRRRDRLPSPTSSASADDLSDRGVLPYGYDERQFCSPGFNLPVGCLMRTPHGSIRVPHIRGQSRPGSAAARGFAPGLPGGGGGTRGQPPIHQPEPEVRAPLGKRGLYNPVGGVNTARDTHDVSC